MKDWQRIRSDRDDITDYVIHYIRNRYESGKYIKPIETLIDIIKCGYLKPSFATRGSIYDSSKRPTIKGPDSAVCFTEQALANFIKSCAIWPSGYRPYGIGIHKRALYQYGGRPVIYGTEDMLGRKLRPNEHGYEHGKEIYTGGLQMDCQYLWVRYQPIPNQDGYVIDWTHEREWRCRIRPYHDIGGSLPEEGMPILLPGVYEVSKWVSYLPIVLVAERSEKEILVDLINMAAAEWKSQCKNRYLQDYYEKLPKVRIVVIKEVEQHLASGEIEWGRLETIPIISSSSDVSA